MPEVSRVGDKIRVGGELTNKQKDALLTAAIPANDILANLNGLSEEITETYSQESDMDQIQRPKAPRKLPAKVQPAPKSRVEQKAEEIAEQMPEPDLDEVLDAAEREVEQAGAETPDFGQQVRQLLKDTEGSPSEAQIEAWKKEKGEVYCLALGKGEVYLFTFLKRAQWQRIRDIIDEMRVKDVVKADKLEGQLKEKVVQGCMLWPKLTVEFFTNARAGIVDALYESIMFNSAFLTPQQVVQLTVSL